MSEPTDEAPPPSVEVTEEIAEPAETTAGTIAGDPLAPPAQLRPGSDTTYTPSGTQPDNASDAGSSTHVVSAPAARRVQVIAALALVGGLGIIALVFLGRANSQRYLLACSTDRVTPEQGRSFPPWGSHPMAGPEWKPVALPLNAECTEHETDNRAELERLYLDLLVDRASTALTTKTLLDKQGNGAAPLDAVSDQLTQALLLARAPERRDQRKEIERLVGDVTYWRAMRRLRDASAALVDAAKQFDAAAAQRPRHVGDADAWASLLRRLADELHAGPSGMPPAAAPAQGAPAQGAPGEPQAPMGSALPVEPPPSAGSAVESAPDAGVPSGGVLL